MSQVVETRSEARWAVGLEGDSVLGGRNAVALIPARGGSKGLPGKNLRKVAGVSLLGLAVRSAKRSNYIDDVYVSSDSPALLAEGSMHGAIPHQRNPDLACDTSTAAHVVLDFLDLRQPALRDSDVLVYLQPTSPLRTCLHVDQALKLLSLSNAAGIISVSSEPVYWEKLVRVDSAGSVKRISTRLNASFNRQDAEELWRPNGAIYAFSVGAFREEGDFPIDSSIAFKMAEEDSVDVDSEDQLKMAEKLLAVRRA